MDTKGVGARDGSNAFSINRVEVRYLESLYRNPVRSQSFTLLFDISIGEPVSETFSAEPISDPPGTRYWARTDVRWTEVQDFYEFQSSWVFADELKLALKERLGLDVENPFTDPLDVIR